MEDNLIFKKKEEDLIFLKMEDVLKNIVQPKTIKSKNNDCGTAPGNLVFIFNPTSLFSSDLYIELKYLCSSYLLVS